MPEAAFARHSLSFDVQGHRGARGLLPENSLPAFLKAIELGVTTLEMDVVISGDDEVVVSHDPYFDPAISSWPDGRPVTEEEAPRLRLYRMTYDQIAQFDCGMRGHPQFPRQAPMAVKKPLLRDVVRVAESHAAELGRTRPLYNIETKCRRSGDGILHPEPGRFVELLHGVLRDAGVITRTAIQSFDERTLRVAREIDVNWRTSLLAEHVTARFMRLKVRKLGFVPDIYSPHYGVVSPRLIHRAHARGMLVVPWTVNEPEEMTRLAEVGVDGLITDYPDIAMAVLERFLTN